MHFILGYYWPDVDYAARIFSPSGECRLAYSLLAAACAASRLRTSITHRLALADAFRRDYYLSLRNGFIFISIS